MGREVEELFVGERWRTRGPVLVGRRRRGRCRGGRAGAWRGPWTRTLRPRPNLRSSYYFRPCRSPRILSIGEVAERTGVSVSALRFYEAEGMVAPLRSRGRPAPVPARRPAPGRVHPGRAAGGPHARRDPRRAWPRFPSSGRPPRPTGRGCRARGRRSSTSGSGCSSACATTCRRASDAAASRCRRAGCTTPTTAPGRSAKGRAICSATPRSTWCPSCAGPPARLNRFLPGRSRRD